MHLTMRRLPETRLKQPSLRELKSRNGLKPKKLTSAGWARKIVRKPSVFAAQNPMDRGSLITQILNWKLPEITSSQVCLYIFGKNIEHVLPVTLKIKLLVRSISSINKVMSSSAPLRKKLLICLRRIFLREKFLPKRLWIISAGLLVKATCQRLKRLN